MLVLMVKGSLKRVLPKSVKNKLRKLLKGHRLHMVPGKPQGQNDRLNQGGVQKQAKAVKGFTVPAWIQPFAEPGPQAPRIMGLSHDLHRANDPALRDGRMVWPLLLHPQDDATLISGFAQAFPDAFLEILLDRLGRIRPFHAVLIDLDDPATQIFARACRMLGIARIHVPSHRLDLPCGLPGKDRTWRAPQGGVCDLALIWNTDQRETLSVAGSQPIGFLQIQPPALPPLRPVSNRKTVLIWLSRAAFWPDPGGLAKFGRGFINLAEHIGFDVDFLFDGDMRQAIPAPLHDAILFSSAARLRLVPHPSDPIDPVLSAVDIVLGDRAANLLRVAAEGVAHLDLRQFMTNRRRVDSGYRLMKDMTNAVMRYFDGDIRPFEVEPLPGYGEAIEAVLQRLAAETIPREASVLEKLLTGFCRDTGTAVTALPKASLDQENRYIQVLLGLHELRRVDRETPIVELVEADLFVQWGLRMVGEKRPILRACRQLHSDLLILEDGFVRSIEIGLQGSPTCSVVIDDMGAFYDATRPSRLETLLNGQTEIDAQQRSRAEAAMARLSTTKVSKYNYAPYRAMPRPRPGRKVVLVVDQRAGDMSILLGMASQASFDTMLAEALALADDHDIYIKTHPDATVGGRASAIGTKALAEAEQRPNVTVIRDDMNPYSLIDIADKVFVVTSGMGFEALIAGKQVHCFGMPFYAGWGLTQDRIGLLRRSRLRSLAEIFYVFYITLSRYVDPETGMRCDLEDLIDRIIETRPWQMDRNDSLDQPLSARPLAPLDVPAPLSDAHSVSAAAPPLGQSGISDYRTLFGISMTDWKQDYFRRILPQHDIHFLPLKPDITDVSRQLVTARRPAFLIWGRNTVPGLSTFAKVHNIPIFRTEDGFLRSVGLGANRILPYSVCLDSRGIYFDATKSSDLEVILETFDFDSDPDLLDEAARGRRLMVEHGLSKYNFAYPQQTLPFGPKSRRRVLVIGQVESDASIRFGASEGMTNNDLVRLARQENPDAQIIYKIHPDVLAGKRAYKSDPADVEDICEIHATPLTLQNAFDGVDHVYCITSLAGFEALMRDIPVTTVGMPFYSGWGLTDDRAHCTRRTRRLTLDQLFAGAYLLYARYADPQTGQPLRLEEVIGRIRFELTSFPEDDGQTPALSLSTFSDQPTEGAA